MWPLLECPPFHVLLPNNPYTLLCPICGTPTSKPSSKSACLRLYSHLPFQRKIISPCSISSTCIHSWCSYTIKYILSPALDYELLITEPVSDLHLFQNLAKGARREALNLICAWLARIKGILNTVFLLLFPSKSGLELWDPRRLCCSYRKAFINTKLSNKEALSEKLDPFPII